MRILTKETIGSLLNVLGTTGQIFTAEFIKKDGTVRIMNCRTGVKKHLRGGRLAFNPKDYGLLPVFDLKKKGYRFVNLNTLRSISHGQEIYYFYKG